MYVNIGMNINVEKNAHTFISNIYEVVNRLFPINCVLAFVTT